MRAKRLEIAPNPAETGLEWGAWTPRSTSIAEKRTLTSAAKLRAVGISAACSGMDQEARLAAHAIRDGLWKLSVHMDHGLFQGSRYQLDGMIIQECIIEACTGEYPLWDVVTDTTLILDHVIQGQLEILAGANQESQVLRAGDTAIWPFTAGTGFRVTESAHQLRFLLPVARLRHAGVDACTLSGLQVPFESLYGPLISGFFVGLPGQLDILAPSKHNALVDMILKMLNGIAKAQGQRVRKASCEVLWDRALKHINDHLEDPHLNPQTIADALDISLRSVHLVFARKGHKVAAHIREQRLQRARDMLQLGLNAIPISQMAHRLGFRDSTAFSRVFRKRFGTAPANQKQSRSP